MSGHDAIKVDEIAYHRNGVSGEGFHVVAFREKDGSQWTQMVAVLFDGAGQCAILDTGLANDGVVTFGRNNWRGDVYEEELRAAIKAWDDKPLIATMTEWPNAPESWDGGLGEKH